MKKIALCLAAAGAFVLSAPASAQGYFGASVGRTSLSSDCTGLTSCDKTGTGGKVYGGYRFLPYLGAEVAYLNFGKAKAVADFGGTPVNAEIKTSGIGAGVAMMGDLGPSWNAFARLGVARMTADVSGSALGVPVSEKDRTTQAYFGLGVGYALNKTVSLDASADFSRSKFEGESSNVRMLGVGLTVKF